MIDPADDEPLAIGRITHDVVADFYRWWGTDAEVPYTAKGVVSTALFPPATPGAIG